MIYVRKIKLLISIVLLFGILWELYGHGNDILVTQISHIVRIILFFILLPKYYINQNSKLKLYVSVYYQNPPPVLPWQLDEDFDPGSTTLIMVDLPN